MKTLYSSTFLSVILGFLMLLNQNGQPIALIKDAPKIQFKTIIERELIAAVPNPGDEKVVEVQVFTSFGCPDCNNFGLSTVKQLKEKYANEAQVKFHLFLTPNKESTSELFAVKGAHCAGKYDRFWDMVEALHKVPDITRREVDLISQEFGLPILEFRQCLDGDEMMPQIDADLAHKQASQIEVRPSTLVDNVLLIGDHPLENIEREIRKRLK